MVVLLKFICSRILEGEQEAGWLAACLLAPSSSPGFEAEVWSPAVRVDGRSVFVSFPSPAARCLATAADLARNVLAREGKGHEVLGQCVGGYSGTIRLGNVFVCVCNLL